MLRGEFDGLRRPDSHARRRKCARVYTLKLFRVQRNKLWIHTDGNPYTVVNDDVNAPLHLQNIYIYIWKPRACVCVAKYLYVGKLLPAMIS